MLLLKQQYLQMLRRFTRALPQAPTLSTTPVQAPPRSLVEKLRKYRAKEFLGKIDDDAIITKYCLMMTKRILQQL